MNSEGTKTKRQTLPLGSFIYFPTTKVRGQLEPRPSSPQRSVGTVEDMHYYSLPPLSYE